MNIKEKIEYLKQNFNPYMILNVNKNDSNEKIEKEYKRLLLKSHPDRGGNSDLFDLVNQAYIYIYNERKSNSGINNYQDFNQLKNEHINYRENEKNYENNKMSSRKFDNDKFNKIYEENRMDNIYDHGYEDWSKNLNDIQQPQNVNSNNFNDSFNKYNKNEVQKYIIPEEMYANNNLDCEELGIKKIDDYTKSYNINNNGKLNYTDLKRALGGNEYIIDNNNNNYDNRDIESYTSKRENCINEVNILEQDYLKQKEIEDKNYENNRLLSLHQMDEQIANHFSRVNNLMISR